MTTPRPHAVILGIACAWCLAFPLLGVWAQLNLFADGSLFSYGVAAGEGWAFHWRQIPVRVAAYAFAALPGANATYQVGVSWGAGYRGALTVDAEGAR